jgi:Zn-dependent protease/CBS domain-containing protein
VREPALPRVGRFAGVPLYFAPSWALIAAVITVLYSSVIQDSVDGIGTGTAYAAAFGFAVALALCVLAHELGHTAVSLALGKPVRRVVILFIGGVTEITDEIERARDEFLVAVAGPLVSALIAGLAYSGAAFTDDHTLPRVLLLLLMWSNIVVAVFNLLPGLPLDGGRVVRALTWSLARSKRTGTRVAAWGGHAIGVLLAVGAAWLLFRGWGPFAAVLVFVMALFIWNGATQALRSADVLDRLSRVRLADLLRPGVLVQADVSVAEAIRRTRERAAGGIVVIDRADRLQAIVTEARIREVPLDRQPWTSVSECARALEPGLLLADTLQPSDLLAAIRATPASEYLVLRADGAPAGILASSDLAAALGAQ